MDREIGRRELIIAVSTALPVGLTAQARQDAEPSVLVIIDLHVRRESIEEAKNMLLGGLSFIRTFDGNRDATLHANQDDPLNLFFVEHWATRQHYERYRAARAERGDNARLVAMLTEPLMVRAFNVLG